MMIFSATYGWGDAIQFSRPAVPIASPDKELPELPESRSKIEFGANPVMERPAMLMPQPVMRMPPVRERDDNEDANRHPLLREPKSFREMGDESESRDRFGPGKSSSSSSWRGVPRNNAPGNTRAEPQHALSPITDLNWDPRDRDRDREQRNDSFSSSRSDASDRKDARARELYGGRQEEPEQKDAFSAPEAPDPFTFRPKDGKESLSAAQMERREAFEQLFNPGGVVVQPPGSLDPVTGLDAIKPTPGPGPAMPMLTGPKIQMAPSTPANGFNAQQERLRLPLPDDFSKRFSQGVKPSPAPVDSHFQSSLMRQPTVHDIPSRKGL